MVIFTRYSEMSKEDRDKLSFLKVKRLMLRFERDTYWYNIFDFKRENSTIRFALKYFDIDLEAKMMFFDKKLIVLNTYKWEFREFVRALSDFFCSLYEQDRGFFQTILGFIFKECEEFINENGCCSISNELISLGYVLDGGLLKATSGQPLIQQKITSVIEDKFKRINNELIEIRQGAIESLLSNKPDKARHVSASCRALIDTLLKDLVPKVDVKEGESTIHKRIEIIFKNSESTCNLVQETTNLVQALNKVQCKGNHSKIDESLAHFIFELTEKVVYFILISRE
jgi:hypothetical protein